MNAKSFKKLVKLAINGAGYDVYRRTPGTNATLQLLTSLQHFGVDFVVDVGANTGQFAGGLRASGYDGSILSVEPLSEAYVKLVSTARRDPKWQVHDRCAAGDHDGEIEINISGNSVSSSVLPIMETHVAAAEQSDYVGKETVKLLKLDTIVPPYLSAGNQTFLKIDTQGFEWEVLNGAYDILTEVRGIVCELSLVQLYDVQRLWMDVLERLENEGLSLWSLNRGFTDFRNGRALQFDATFFRL